MRVIWGYVSILVLAFGFTAFAGQGAEAPLMDVFFDRGEFTLREDAKPVLAENAEILAMNPGTEVEIIGYCNTYEGTPVYNLGLKRAEAVRSFLIEQGVNLSDISIGADCGGAGDKGNPPPGPAEVKAALDSRVSIKAGPRSGPGVL
ncbi:MAG TPA: OmpA family protein [Thermodesulfobacteriota bacterium]|nr:OmpA family protein [Thermodesulfobacteriota bacterium]